MGDGAGARDQQILADLVLNHHVETPGACGTSTIGSPDTVVVCAGYCVSARVNSKMPVA